MRLSASAARCKAGKSFKALSGPTRITGACTATHRLERPLSLGTSDRHSHLSARTIQSFNDQFKRLADGVHIPAEDKPALGRLIKAFRLKTEAADLIDKVTAAQKRKQLPRGGIDFALVESATAGGVLTAAEAQQVKEALAACLSACEVDVFKSEHYYR